MLVVMRYVSDGEVFKSKLWRGSMGRKVWVGTLVKLEVVMGLVFGKLLGRVEIISLIEPPLEWVMAKGLSFGQIDGV